MLLVHVKESFFEISDLLFCSCQFLVLLLDLCLILFNEGIVLYSYLVHHCICFFFCLCNDLFCLGVGFGNDAVTLLLCTEECVLQCIFITHVFPYLVCQNLNFVVAVIQFSLGDCSFFFQLIQEFINVFLFIAESSFFKP